MTIDINFQIISLWSVLFSAFLVAVWCLPV